MKFISGQPDSDYFIWQVQVQLNNFRKFDIEKDAIVLFGYDKEKGINKNVFTAFKNSKASFHFIPDCRCELNKSYVSSIRPYLLKFFFTHTKIVDDLFYHDCDIIFNRLPDFNKMSVENKVQLSDTVSYIGAEYIMCKGQGLLEEMCAVVGIDPNVVRANQSNSGGAQYFIPKSVPMTLEFWNKVQKDSVKLYRLMVETSNKYNPKHPIQSWTADMWALLWNFWLSGVETSINKELEFSWATTPLTFYDNYNIYHNAGVTPDRKELF